MQGEDKSSSGAELKKLGVSVPKLLLSRFLSNHRRTRCKRTCARSKIILYIPQEPCTRVRVSFPRVAARFSHRHFPFLSFESRLPPPIYLFLFYVAAAWPRQPTATTCVAEQTVHQPLTLPRGASPSPRNSLATLPNNSFPSTHIRRRRSGHEPTRTRRVSPCNCIQLSLFPFAFEFTLPLLLHREANTRVSSVSPTSSRFISFLRASRSVFATVSGSSSFTPRESFKLQLQFLMLLNRGCDSQNLNNLIEQIGIMSDELRSEKFRRFDHQLG